MLRKHFNKKQRNEHGLSLVELLVTMVLISILAATVTMVTLNQRVKANDATLKSDLRQVANQVTSYTIDNDFFPGNTRAVIIEGEGRNAPVTNPRWNEIINDPTIHVSPNVTIEVIIIGSPSGSTWHSGYDPGEYCLAGTHSNSNYNYEPGEGNRSRYNKYLFFDLRLGGVKTIEELVEAHNNGQNISCYGYASGYIENS